MIREHILYLPRPKPRDADQSVGPHGPPPALSVSMPKTLRHGGFAVSESGCIFEGAVCGMSRL